MFVNAMMKIIIRILFFNRITSKRKRMDKWVIIACLFRFVSHSFTFRVCMVWQTISRCSGSQNREDNGICRAQCHPQLLLGITTSGREELIVWVSKWPRHFQN